MAEPKAALAAILAALTLTGCAAGHSARAAVNSQPPASPAASTPTAVASAAATSTKRVCAELLHLWQHGPGGRLVNKVQDDIGVLLKSNTAAQAEAAAPAIAADSHAALDHLPPSCIPGEAAAETTYMRDYAAAASYAAAGDAGGIVSQLKAAERWVLRAARDQVRWATGAP